MNLAKRFLLLAFTAFPVILTTPCLAKQSDKGVFRAKPVPAAAHVAALRIAYLHQPGTKYSFPDFDPAPTEAGLQGARLAIADNNTTGSFTRQKFELNEQTAGENDDVVPVFQRLMAEGYRHILVDLPPESILRLATLPGAEEALIFDVASADDRLRGDGCAGNVFHLLPSRAMRADALAQYLAKKRWARWFLVVGPGVADRLYADAVERAAKRFGGKIVARKSWEHDFGERRTPESEIPVFTQGVDYDVLVVADEAGDFGDLLTYRTWSARPVAGTQGLMPTAWHRTHEAWGALQLQKRFRERADRWMGEADYGAWLAIRAIGEAAARTKSMEFDVIRKFLGSEQFALAGFKGVPLSFRPWDRQLRQPVLLAQERSLVAVAPIEGFIHPENELDTLGYDRTESTCRAKPLHP